jgi:hypothetical protein
VKAGLIRAGHTPGMFDIHERAAEGELRNRL